MNRVVYSDPKEKFILSLNYLKRQIENHREAAHNVSSVVSDTRRQELIKKIQNVFLMIAEHTVRGEVPSVLISRRANWKNCNFDKRLSKKGKNSTSCQEVTFIGNEKRFVIICSLLRTIHRLLLTQSSVTKRELYYEKTGLFGNQNTVNTALLDVCDLLQAAPWELRVLSTSKGLVAGDLTITTSEREVIDCNKPGGVLVPQDVNGISKIKSSARFVLIVEKDAAFQKLLDDEAHLRLGPCIIITGKGEPDINTRMLVCRLNRELKVPILILVDADPYGIEIMCTYRFGSLTMIQHSAELACPEARWLGLHPTDIDKFSIPTVPFTNMDYRKARELCQRPYILQNKQLLKQVNCLLEGGKKSEIENLSALSPTFVTDMFLPFKITSRKVI